MDANLSSPPEDPTISTFNYWQKPNQNLYMASIGDQQLDAAAKGQVEEGQLSSLETSPH
ncbi:hypothetical protein [Synechococcus lacustris]|uniref:hypothetical protein n=1 Tax=Synechococcus lacustris TaxID=2116544 RepID=UPI0013A59F68|nr:hypothetical protein [Synechococcus lacustris]